MPIFKFVILKLSYLLLFFIPDYAGPLHSIAEPLKVTKMITVRDGLPQSYVSGVFQDKNGFLWLSTLNGLGRYDGRLFKNYQHTSADRSGLSGNMLLHLFDAGNDQLLIGYMDGKIDKLNTNTDKITHLWTSKGFDMLQHEGGYFKSLVCNSQGICWMMSRNGGIYRIDLHRSRITYSSPLKLKINEPVLGIAIQDNHLLLFTRSRLFSCNDNGIVNRSIPYPFKTIELFTAGKDNIYSSAVRKGDLIITDNSGLKIWNPATHFFQQVKLMRQRAPGKLVASFDHSGNYYFEYNSGISILRPDNTLVNWSPVDQAIKGLPTSMYIDRSDVLWVGTNGFGLRQYNLLRTGLPGYINNHSFITDVLGHCQIPAAQIAKTFLNRSLPYSIRSATFKDTVWIADVNQSQATLQLALVVNKTLKISDFHNSDFTTKPAGHRINFLCFDTKGVLWGLDQYGQFIKFDTRRLAFQVGMKISIDPNEEINGMVADNGSVFYICTNKSLLRVDEIAGRTENLTAFLPGVELRHLAKDPDDDKILWIGTLSDGLIRFDISKKKSQVFSVAAGLPNNTIYGILPDGDDLLWCSSNKGIFAFNKKNQTVRSFTSRDGLTEDEFNRYNYIKLPGGEMAFGGPSGYTVFNPAKLTTDEFNPQITLTDLNVINKVRYDKPLNELKELYLQHDQNFITATFAAMQFDSPEKLQYRYRLIGLDKNWIMQGNENKVSYTSIPPGDYTLLLNASNTSGKWSRYVRRIKIIVAPPYWETWWFYCMLLALIIVSIYLFLTNRIRNIKKVQAQKLRFEREAMELHALALRARMNPHFIFNCLNSIKALIQEKHDQKAINYLTTFSTLIRKQLNNTRNDITLMEELETCKLYLELESMRFDNRIDFEINTENDDDLQRTVVPPLILQPIVENAVVHGLLPSERRGHVNIKVYRKGPYAICEIEDNGVGRLASDFNKRRSNRLHESRGISLLQERIAIDNRLDHHVFSMHTTDLFSPDGKSSGTLVMLKFNIGI